MPKSLEFLLALDNTRFNQALDVSQRKVKAVGMGMAAGFDPLMNKLKAVRSTMANVAAVGAGIGAAGFAIGITKANQVLQESINLAAEQERAESKLEAVLKATGGAAGFSADELKKYAGELQGLTTYG